MNTRDGINALKIQIWWRIQRKDFDLVSASVEGFEEYRGELAHFIEWINAGNSSVDIHNLAAEIGILDNMKLAERLYRIEQSIEEIKYTEPD